MQNDVQTSSSPSLIQDSARSILRSAAGFFSGTALSRITGLFRDMSLAYAFGTDAALAAFFVAFRLSHALRRLFGEGALQSAFVPFFEELRQESQEKAIRFFRDLNLLWALVLTAAIALGMGTLFTYLHVAKGEGASNEVLYLTALMLPSLLPICLFGLNGSFLQCEKKYFTVGVAPVAFNLLFALAAFVLKDLPAASAMPSLALAVVLACSFQWLVTLIPSIRLCGSFLKNGFWEHIQLFSQEMKRLWKPLSLGMLGVGASQINNAVDALFARAADLEGPAQLWFSVRFQQVPLALFGIALAGALLPPLSRSIQAGDTTQFLSFLRFSIRKTFAFLMPCTIYLFVNGMSIIHCAYGRGDFQAHSILTTTQCLQGYLFALLPMGLVLIFAPAFYAKKEYLIPTRGALLALLMNTLFDALLVYCFDMKAVSIAVATSIASWLNGWYLYHHLQKEWGTVMDKEGYGNGLKVFLCSLIAGLCTFCFLGALQGYPALFGYFQETAGHLPESLYERISFLMASSLVFGATLFGSAYLIKASDLLSLWKKPS